LDFRVTDFLADAQARYDDALVRRDAIHAEWVADGSRLLAENSTGQPVEHPYLRDLPDPGEEPPVGFVADSEVSIPSSPAGGWV
jgi:hypothetical protein